MMILKGHGRDRRKRNYRQRKTRQSQTRRAEGTQVKGEETLGRGWCKRGTRNGWPTGGGRHTAARGNLSPRAKEAKVGNGAVPWVLSLFIHPFIHPFSNC